MPSASEPPRERAIEQRAARRRARRRSPRHCARDAARRCEYSSWRNSSAAPIRTLESEPTPKRPPSAEEFRRIECAVAEIGFGDRAKPRDRARCRHVARLFVGHVGGMNQAPAAIDRRVIEQPVHRTFAAPGDAILDLFGLFGDMDMDWAVLRRAAGSRQVRRGVTARNECGAMPTIAPSSSATARREASIRRAKPIDIVDEAALAVHRAASAKTGMRIEHRQQRQPDAAGLRGSRNALGEFADIGVRRARTDRDEGSEIRRPG